MVDKTLSCAQHCRKDHGPTDYLISNVTTLLVNELGLDNFQ